MSTYLVYYTNWSSRNTLSLTLPEGKGIADVTGGFWTNDAGEYTQGSDCKYYIPASQLGLIVRQPAENKS